MEAAQEEWPQEDSTVDLNEIVKECPKAQTSQLTQSSDVTAKPIYG